MKSFQLDQCSDHPSFVAHCNSKGECEVRRLPPHLRDEDDEVILAALLPGGAPIVTLDFGIVYDNRAHIFTPNGGIIIVKARPNTSVLMEKMIAKFKRVFPKWAEIDWSGTYVEIEHTDVYVCPLIDGDITGGQSFSFELPDFAIQLENFIMGYARPAVG